MHEDHLPVQHLGPRHLPMMRHAKQEDGWVLITAIVVMALMLMVGLAVLSVADNQQRQGGQERVRESSFNLSEGGLYQQSLILSRRWPRNASLAYPPQCTQADAAQTLCPLPGALVKSVSGGSANSIFNAVDFNTGATVTWTLKVRDNSDASGNPTAIYSKAVADGAQGTACPTAPCTWDANRDRKIWVRADATVRGKTRSMVALLQLDQIRLPFPTNVVQAGWVHASNSGNKTLVNTQGNATTGSQVLVGCVDQGAPDQKNNTCNGWDAGQVSPSRYCNVGSPGCPSSVPPGMTPDALQKAIENADRTYTNVCPDPKDKTQWQGIVYINAANNNLNCTMDPNGNAPVNSNSATCDANDPSTTFGMIIMTRGQLTIGSNDVYCGIIYMPNLGTPPLTQLSKPVVTLGSGAAIYGGVVVDNGGGVEVGQACGGTCSTATITYDPNAFPRVAAAGAAGLVQNSWRELAPTQ